jgi:hypothetical protein
VKAVALALRFLVAELGALVALVWWGIDAGGFGIVLGLVLAFAVIALWAAFVAPKALRRLDDPARIVLELVIFAGATAAFLAVGQPIVAIAYAIVAVLTAVATRYWGEPGEPA